MGGNALLYALDVFLLKFAVFIKKLAEAQKYFFARSRDVQISVS